MTNNKIMHCFITGVSGFIGSATAKKLLAQGHTVSGLTSSKSGLGVLSTKGIKPVLGDIRQPQQWMEHIRDTDAVKHLATLPIPARPRSRYVKELIHTQQSVTRQMLSALSSHCKIKEMLKVELNYPTYREGISALAKEARNTAS